MSVPTVTPASPLSKEGKSGTSFTSNQAVTWATTGGSLSSITSTSVIWIAPNVTGTYTLTATNAGSEVRTITINVTAVMPAIYFDWRKPSKKKKKVLLFEPEEGAEQTRSKGDGRRFHEIGCEDAPTDQFAELQALWDAHYPNKKVIATDPITGLRHLYLFDAELNFSYNSHTSISWNTAIKEAWPYGVAV